ncbi:geranylgeranylglycerol-phosphate geranylgeranyltransferase [Psychroflexus tropicus]|uniref:geranylgeranylglycerol-phosphate geranylgeranyltransferase n=1 Tax=Psychroflexus tropicus TaxID=197345 RepID=UPI00037F1930|nr:geranylgeranylglycerol-phosphate geranylgeranyltransferase [Psychroflexus tropicus]
MYILNLIRWKNLLILIFSALLIRFSLLPGFGVDLELSLFHYSLVILAVVCFGAGGNIINDFFDITTDSINKPQRLVVDKLISREKTLGLYGMTNLLGLASLLYLLINQAFESHLLVFYILLASPLALAAYSIWLKKKAIIGNILVSLLVGLSIYCLGTILIEKSQHPVVFFTIIVYSVLTFLINLSREMVKDIEDIKGDYFCGMSTLPILIGKRRTNYIVFSIIILSVFILLSILLTYFLSLNLVMFYMFTFVILPLILISKRTLSAKSEKDYKDISSHLKLVFLTGLCSMITFLFI